jgi:hypothetical protein
MANARVLAAAELVYFWHAGLQVYMRALFITAMVVGGVLINSANAQSLSFTGGTYTQDFNSLTTQGQDIAGALNGWASSDTSITVGNGDTTGTGLFSLGTTANDPDRALALRANNTVARTPYFGLRLVNNSANAYTKIALSFVGEQWRAGQDVPLETLTFSYRINTGTGAWTDTGFTSVSTLNFQSIVNNQNPAIPVDGNALVNQSSLSSTITLPSAWANGQTLWLRWVYDESTGNASHSLAIDNFTFVPEPYEYGLVGVLGLLGYAAYDRRLKLKKA